MRKIKLTSYGTTLIARQRNAVCQTVPGHSTTCEETDHLSIVLEALEVVRVMEDQSGISTTSET